MLKFIAIIIVSSFVWLPNAFGQSPVYTNISVHNGLPSNESYAVFQDSKGYVWIGTDRGVVRYDGYEYEVFTTSNGLTDNVIFDFAEDKKGNIWFEAFNGKICYFNGSGFIQVPIEDSIQPPGAVLAYHFVDDTVFVDYLNSEIALVPTSTFIDSTQIERDEYTFAKHRMLYQSRFSVHYKLKIKDLQSKQRKKFFYSTYLYETYDEGAFYFCQKDSLLIHRKDQSEVSVKLNGITSCIRYHNGKLLILMRKSGLFELDPEDATPSLNRIVPLSNFNSYFLIDRENVLWVSTLNNGIYKYNNIDIRTIDGLNEISVKQLFHQEALHVVGKEQIYKWNGNTPEAMLSHSSDALEWISCYNASDTSVNCLGENGAVAVFQHSQLVDFIPPKIPINSYTLNQAVNVQNKNYTFYHSIVMCKDTLEYLEKLNGVNMNIGVIAQLESVNNELIMACGISGISLLNPENDSVTVLGTIYPELSTRVSVFRILPDGRLVIGTRGKGVYILKNVLGNPESNSLEVLNRENGLVGNMVSDIETEGDSILWIATNLGISRIRLQSFEPMEYTIDNFTIGNGLSSNMVNDLQLVGDTLFAGTIMGVNHFSKYASPSYFVPDVLLHSIRFNKKEASLQPYYALDYQQRVIDLKFSGISTREQDQLQYKYRLIGSDTNWTYTSNRTLQFLSLSQGDYELEIYAVNSNGMESTHPLKLRFKINPPWYAETWFILGSSLLVLCIIALIFYYRLKRIREENNLRLELFKLENKALSSQMNPHFIFNALTAIQHYVLKEEKMKAYGYLSSFSNLMRAILKNSEDENVRLSEEIKLLENYLELEKIRFKEKFSYSIVEDDGIEPEDLYIPSMLIQPYAENSIRHGFLHKEGTGNLEIRFSIEGSNLVCEITDDGVGRAAAQEFEKEQNHRSFAMGINQRRLQLLNRLQKKDLSTKILDLVDGEGKACGTKVVLHIPLE